MTTTQLPRDDRADPFGPVSYQVGASTPAGLWLGLTAPALGLLGSGLLLSVLAALSRMPLVLALVPIVVSVSLALLPVAGRPLQAWAVPTITHARTHLTGHSRWLPPPIRHLLTASSDSATHPVSSAESPAPPVGALRLRLPAEYGRPALVARHLDPHAAADAGPALLLDRAAGTVTIVFAVAGVDRFPLLDSIDQDRLLAGWGSALTLLSRDPAIRRAQLLDRQAPPPGSSSAPELASLSASLVGDETSAGTADRDADYQALRAQVQALTLHRDSLLAVQWRADAFGPGIVAAGDGRRGREHTGLLTAARERVQHLTTQLLCGQLLARPLDAAELTATLTGFLTGSSGVDPTSAALNRDTLAESPLIGSRRNAWDHVRVDDSWHRSYAVTDWPRTPTAGGWLAPLLLTAPTGSARTFAVHLQPIPPAQAARLARSARIRADLDLADRHRLGLPPSAAADLTADGAAWMDAELVAGHSAHHLSAILTTSAPSLEQLETGSAQLQEAALSARLAVQPLHGQHHLALAATLPLCRLRSTGRS
jgi:hypothetical protein